jgi:mannitol/fructose-specific phosphotransferase system IIA component (Ntr-type)
VSDTTRAKIYVGSDEESLSCVADVVAYRARGLTGILENVAIAHQRTNSSTVYLDDISLTRTEKEYSPAPSGE